VVGGEGERRGRDISSGNWRGNLRESVHLKSPGVDVRIILYGIFQK
jgi:hypothetical protein